VTATETLVIVNPAACGGRAAERAAPLLDTIGAHTVVRTEGPGHASVLATTPSARRVIAVGGDGTVHEVVQGLLRRASPAALGILPLGTGNSFVRDLGISEPTAAAAAIAADRRRAVDVVQITCADRTLWSINLFSLGFTAEAGALTNRRFKTLGAAGYIAAVVVSVARLHHPTVPYALDDGPMDTRPLTFVSFSNSRFTGGAMKMAPDADISDGWVDVIRVGALARGRLLTAFPRIFSGTHVAMAEVEHRRARRAAFALDGPRDLMVDGEVIRAWPQALEVLPGALQVLA
jgi:YegS/Rv2252/BmrU family lipid kinase